MRRRLLAIYVALLVALVGAAAGGGVYLFRQTGPSDAIEATADAHAYDVVSWEIRYLPQKWLYKLGHLFHGSSKAQDDVTLNRYFQLTRQIRRLEESSPASGELPIARGERAALENEIEDILEGRVTSLLEEEGLVLNPPLFSRLDLVFPPVDFELDSPPRVLAISPRDRIELDRNYLLSPGLDLDTIAAIEREAEAEAGDVSAAVINTSGVATYPSVVSELASYESLIETIIHEWVHQYLVFFPLGRSYFASDELRTLNETVASLAGRELARLFIQRYGSFAPPPEPAPAPVGGFDFFAEMRALRSRVEELLSAGEIKRAEALMRRKRDEFQEGGVYIRRINQAYFAFQGFYADAPGSIDPIGPKLERLLQRAGSPGAFLRLASALGSEADLDELLSKD